MDDIDAFVQLAGSRMNATQLNALITALARKASAWPGYMAELQERGGRVKGDWESPNWDMDLVMALRRAASQVEGKWAASEDRRQRWNRTLETQYHPRHYGSFLYELGPAPEEGS